MIACSPLSRTVRCFRITDAQLPRWQSELEALSEIGSFPLGNDSFTISNGKNYFAFFARLGTVYYHAIEDQGRLIAVGCGVLRDQPRRWFGADLRVHPEYRGRRLSARMARRVLLPSLLRCTRGYGIAMNPTDGRLPAVLRLADHFHWLRLGGQVPLWFYTSNADQMRSVRPLLERHRGPIHFISLAGMRDLVLESTGRPLMLLHVGYGVPRDRITFSEPQPGYTYMWCAPAGDPVAQKLSAAGIDPAVTGRILHRGLADFDWTTLSTAEM